NKELNFKLPQFHKANCLIDKKGFEQSTSEAVAEYKATLLSGKKLLVLGAGIGIDDIAFSKTFEKITSIEPNIELNDVSRFNFNQLSIHNIERIDKNALEFLSLNTETFDCIYSDPDRRDEKGRQILLK